MKTVYLSGKITGDANYHAKFREAREKLLAKGYEVINPAAMSKVVGHALDYWDLLEIDLELLSFCDAVVQLPDWRESQGALIEYGYAIALDKTVFKLHELTED